MAKKRIPPGQVNNKNNATLRKLQGLMKAFDKKFSIKVGIIGEQAVGKVPDSELNYAELGAIHEFGATIYVTDKMRKFLGSQGLHLKKETTQIIIPTRSFLRMPLLSSEGQKTVKNRIFQHIGSDPEMQKLILEGNPELLKEIANSVALAAELQVLDAFNQGGYGKWAPISEYTKKHRKGSPQNPPLDDTGSLIETAIQSKVEEIS